MYTQDFFSSLVEIFNYLGFSVESDGAWGKMFAFLLLLCYFLNFTIVHLCLLKELRDHATLLLSSFPPLISKVPYCKQLIWLFPKVINGKMYVPESQRIKVWFACYRAFYPSAETTPGELCVAEAGCGGKPGGEPRRCGLCPKGRRCPDSIMGLRV